MKTVTTLKTFNQSFLFTVSFVLSTATLQLSADENWSYTYNSLGLQETADGPRTDVNDVTSYTYDAAGNKTSMTNALGQITQYFDYDAQGNVGRMTDPNGVETIMTYHPRGWLASSTVLHPSNSNLDATTTYEYHPVSGLITQMILPNGSVLNYEYDAARRLTDISNNLGERIEYTLDAEGNQIQEVTSENGNITRVVTRAFDELSRVMEEIGNNGQVTQQDYDLNDNNTATTDGNANTTAKNYDPLNRVRTITQADNTEIDFLYDDLDRIVGVQDSRDVTTLYTYDAYDNVLSEISPDRGTILYTYDNANNRTSQIDARGISSTYTYDALNRLTSVVFNEDSQHPENISYSYDNQSNGNLGVGKLTGYSDESGSTALKYNNLGQLIEKNYTIKGKNYTQKWTYDAAGNLTSETYPLGRVVEYTLDALGRVTDIATRANASAALQNLISNVTYQPFGGVKSYSYANGISVDYNYDLDGRITHITASGAAPLQEKIYHYDLADNILGIDDNRDANFDQIFALDALNRITQDLGFYGERQFQYDASSNRIERSVTTAIGTTTVSYSYESLSNRLTQQQNKIISSDAAGNIISIENPNLAIPNDKNKYFTYNDQGRLATYGDATTNPMKRYQYNALGQRVFDEHLANKDKTLHYTQSGAYQARYIQNDLGRVVSKLEWVYLAGMPIAQIDTRINSLGIIKSENIFYMHTDHLATPRLMSNQNQTLVWRWDSDAFGQGGIENDVDMDAEKNYSPLRFPGQIAEGPSGLYYNYFRDYDPKLGRYIQSDPIGLEGGLNTFGYVYQNSLVFYDPKGLEGICGPGKIKIGIKKDGSVDCRDNHKPDESPCMTSDCAWRPPEHNDACVQECINIEWEQCFVETDFGKPKTILKKNAAGAAQCAVEVLLTCSDQTCDKCDEKYKK